MLHPPKDPDREPVVFKGADLSEVISLTRASRLAVDIEPGPYGTVTIRDFG